MSAEDGRTGRALLVILVIFVVGGVVQGVVLGSWSSGVGTILGATIVYGVLWLAPIAAHALMSPGVLAGTAVVVGPAAVARSSALMAAARPGLAAR